MNNKNVTVLDFGMCNLLNMVRAFEHIGCTVNVTESASEAAKAQRLVVPGVGAFKHCIDELKSRHLDQGILEFIASGRPFLGVCVGMQMLFEQSSEFGTFEGLGILKGCVERISDQDVEGNAQSVPHIGWNALVTPESERHWNGSLLNLYQNKSPAVYFVHSYAAVPTDNSIRLADCIYGGHRVCAAIETGNVMATQFHPERSGQIGLKVLEQFVSY